MLVFSWNHPKADLKPETQSVLQEMVNDAKQETQEELGLPADWQPPTPNTQKADKKIAKDFSQNFENSAEKLAPNESDAKTIELAHYHPEYQKNLSPELKTLLAKAETAAQQTTQAEDGLPENWQPPLNSKGFDALVKKSFDNSFENQLAQQQNLTPSDKAQLKTLHFIPNAQVPDRQKLLPLLKQINAEAKQEVKEEFKYPG